MHNVCACFLWKHLFSSKINAPFHSEGFFLPSLVKKDIIPLNTRN